MTVTEESWDEEGPALFADCAHSVQDTRLRTIKNGAKAIYKQCLCCGCSTSNAIPKSSLTEAQYSALPIYDDSIKERYDAARSEALRKQFLTSLTERDDSKIIHTEEYHAYLLTDAWRSKRALVLKRAKYVCEGCLTAPATQVHHLTYKHIFNELLFELVAICESCHATCHPEKQ